MRFSKSKSTHYASTVAAAVGLSASLVFSNAAGASSASHHRHSPTPSQNVAAGSTFTSSWAQPVPATPSIDPNSSSLVNAWVAQMTNSQVGTNNTVGVNYQGAAGNPIYTVPANQPNVTVTAKPGCAAFTTASSSDPDAVDVVPIPAAAITSGSGDSPLIINQPSTNTEWEFWQASPNSDGTWSACNGGKLPNYTTSKGVFDNGSVDGYGMSASGASYLGTLLTEGDVSSGSINHAMAFTVESNPGGAPYNDCNGFVAPANRADPACTQPGEPPEGTRMIMPKSVPMPPGLTPLAQMVFTALQNYGLVLVDSSGQYVMAQAESSCDSPGACTAGMQSVSSPQDPITQAMGGQPEWSAFDGIPWNDLQVLTPVSF